MTLLADDNGRYLGVLVEPRRSLSLPRPLSPSSSSREEGSHRSRGKIAKGVGEEATLLKATLAFSILTASSSSRCAGFSKFAGTWEGSIGEKGDCFSKGRETYTFVLTYVYIYRYSSVSLIASM